VTPVQEIRHDQMDSTANTRRRYNEIFSGEGILQRDSFYLWLISLLKPERGKILLDISCGQGRLVKFAAQRGLRAIGLDFAEDGVRLGRNLESPASGWTVGDGERLPVRSASVDFVTHIGSLEHYQDPDAGIREIRRVLKPGGAACILLPNSYGLFGNIKHVAQTGDIFDDGQPLQRYNTRQGWQGMIARGGLQTYRTLKYERELPRTLPDLWWYLKSPSKLARLLAAPFVPVNLANCIVYLCRPEEGR
jgi:SAM-dependent methyltransferase